MQHAHDLKAVARPRGVWTPPTVLRGHSRDLCRTDEKILGVPHPTLGNVVPANILVIVAHLVTLSESQWNQFHPRATTSWGFPWPLPQLLWPRTPLGTPLHTPRHVPLVLHFLQNSARTNSQTDHFIIIFVTNHYICNKCSNEVNFYICTKLALLQTQL